MNTAVLLWKWQDSNLQAPFGDRIYSPAGQPIAQHFHFFETRMRFELIQNGFAIRCLRHSAILSFTNYVAEGVGVEPTRVISSEQFSRLWPPPIGLPFQNFCKKKAPLKEMLESIIVQHNYLIKSTSLFFRDK